MDKLGNGGKIPPPKGKRKRIADGEEVGVQGIVPWTVSVHIIIAHMYELHLVGNAIFCPKFFQTLRH